MELKGWIMRYKKKQIEKAFEQGSECELWINPDRTASLKKCFICNDPRNISDLGNYICQQGYKVGIVWAVKNRKIVVNLRSIGSLDVSLIASSYGGGGHKNAARFTIDNITKFRRIFG